MESDGNCIKLQRACFFQKRYLLLSSSKLSQWFSRFIDLPTFKGHPGIQIFIDNLTFSRFWLLSFITIKTDKSGWQFVICWVFETPFSTDLSFLKFYHIYSAFCAIWYLLTFLCGIICLSDLTVISLKAGTTCHL